MLNIGFLVYFASLLIKRFFIAIFIAFLLHVAFAIFVLSKHKSAFC